MASPHGISDLGIAYPKDVERFINALRVYGGVFNSMCGDPDPKGVMAVVDYLERTAISELSFRLSPRRHLGIEDTLDMLNLSVEEIEAFSDEEIGIFAANLRAVVLYAKRLRERLAEADYESALIDMFFLGTSFIRADMIKDAQAGAKLSFAQPKGGAESKKAKPIVDAINFALPKSKSKSADGVWRYLRANFRAPANYLELSGYLVFISPKIESDIKHESICYKKDGEDDELAEALTYRAFERYVHDIKKGPKPKYGFMVDGKVEFFIEAEET